MKFRHTARYGHCCHVKQSVVELAPTLSKMTYRLDILLLDGQRHFSLVINSCIKIELFCEPVTLLAATGDTYDFRGSFDLGDLTGHGARRSCNPETTTSLLS